MGRKWEKTTLLKANSEMWSTRKLVLESEKMPSTPAEVQVLVTTYANFTRVAQTLVILITNQAESQEVLGEGAGGKKEQGFGGCKATRKDAR